MRLVQEFKEFAIKGNAVDLAVGIIVGAAFGKVVNSLVIDIIMPPIGRMLGNVNFSNFFINLSSTPFSTLAEAQKAGAPTLNYGNFIQSCVDFLIIAMAIFIVIKGMNMLRRKEVEQPTEAPQPSEDILLLRDIRDSLAGDRQQV